MSQVKHTPGPWHVIGNIPAIAAGIGPKDKPAVIARIEIEGAGFVHVDDYRERDANAALISAAPELLKAVNQLITEMERGYVFISQDTIDMAVRAAKKAEGAE